jgi:hypothetical protein
VAYPEVNRSAIETIFPSHCEKIVSNAKVFKTTVWSGAAAGRGERQCLDGLVGTVLRSAEDMNGKTRIALAILLLSGAPKA